MSCPTNTAIPTYALDIGSAFVYTEASMSGAGPSRFWPQTTVLIPRGGPQNLTRFGYSVAIDPAIRAAAAGTPAADRKLGWAFMFGRVP